MKIKDWKRSGYRTAAAVGIVTVLLLVCSIVGTGNGSERAAKRYKESRAASAQSSMAEEKRLAEQASMEASRAEETAVHEMEITYMESQLLTLLKEKFDSQDLDGAARLLLDNEKEFQNLFFDRLETETWIYDGERITDQAEGWGMVFVKAGAVFYGDFKDGMPSGEGTALQAVTLEEGRRYDYSKGTWKAGVMDGAGVCGYSYFDGVTEGSARAVEKAGTFAEDLMEGQFQYTSTNMEGNTTSWTMTARQGVLVLDERWSPMEETDGAVWYQLMADNDSTHAYTVTEEDAKEVRWKNMIQW